MAVKCHIASLVVVFLLTQCNISLFTYATTTVAFPPTNITDQQVSGQYYRPYNTGGNRRPIYNPAYYNYVYNQRPAAYNQRPLATTRRPSYPAPTIQRPSYPTSNINNNRPATTAAERFPNGLCSASPNTYQQYGICWDAAAQRMQIGSNLSIENFVRFYVGNTENYSFQRQETSNYYDALCDQSRRFNGVGVFCAADSDTSDDVGQCNDSHINGGGRNEYNSVVHVCRNGHCVCVVGDKYEELAISMRPNILQPLHVVFNVPGGYSGPVSTQAIQQFVQQQLASAGIHWRP